MARRFNKKPNLHAGKSAARPPAHSPASTPAADDPRRKSSSNRRTFLISALLFLVTLAVFWPCTRNDFINYDDDVYVTGNPHVQLGLTAPAIAWAFQSGETSNWHPLTWMSHMLDCQFYGLKPAGHHFTSVLLHSINAALLFLVLNLLTGAFWRSLAVAALFALHPLRVESVAWVAERKDVLSATLWLLTIWAHVHYARAVNTRGRFRRFYILALLFFMLALMSKPMVVTLPFVLLLLDWWPLRRFDNPHWRFVLLEKIPCFVLSVIACVLTLHFQQASGAVHSGYLPLSARLETALISYFRYLGKMFWPAGLSIHYPYPSHWPMLAVFASAIALLAISAGAIIQRKNLPWLAVGWFWYVGTLVPVIGLVQVDVQSMADRYTYLPGIGVLVLLVWGASAVSQRLRLPNVLPIVLMASLIACALLTRRQIEFWQNGQTIFTHAIAVTTDNEVAYTHLGDYLLNHGEPQQAMAMFRESIRIDPRVEEPQTGLTWLMFLDGRRDEAIQKLEHAAQLIPDSAAVRNNLGVMYKEQGRFAEAGVKFQEALKLRPAYPEAQVGLASIWLTQGRRDEAISLLKLALQARPGFPLAEKLLRQATTATRP